MKKKILTNRELSEKLEIPIGKIRRNTKEFLGADPIATKRSGYQREFSINDGFFVALGTVLVSHHGLSFDNARKAIDLIKPWLLKIGYVPDPPKNANLRGIERKIDFFNITFNILKGELIDIFEVHGEIYGEDIFKEDSYGLRYAELGRKNVYYCIKNDSGKIGYFLPWELDDEKTHDMLIRECGKVDGVRLSDALNEFVQGILDEEDELLQRWFVVYYKGRDKYKLA